MASFSDTSRTRASLKKRGGEGGEGERGGRGGKGRERGEGVGEGGEVEDGILTSELAAYNIHVHTQCHAYDSPVSRLYTLTQQVNLM